MQIFLNIHFGLYRLVRFKATMYTGKSRYCNILAQILNDVL